MSVARISERSVAGLPFRQLFFGVIALGLWLSVHNAIAQGSATPTSTSSESAQVPSSPIKELGDSYHNSIKLLQNRFRVDHNVDELTLIFFRKYGSAPVVLVRPDGSKIFQSQVDGENVQWYDDATYDMIRIKNPVPGPWQAVGQVLPGSRAMVLSDVQLHAEPLPKTLFSGEILKQTAYLTNGDKPIEYEQFRDVVDLSIEFVSTNNPDFDNFGAGDALIATFEDNGRGMDEVPMDGTFTGQFNLAVTAGEWKPIFRVTTPMFTREQVDPLLRLYPNPVLLSVTMDDGVEGYHTLYIDVERDLVDINSLLVDGKVRYPNGDVDNFSLTEPGDEPREHKMVALEEGMFRVKLTAYGTTTDGRDFILDVPEYTFLGKSATPPAIEQKEEVTSPANTQAPASTSTSTDVAATVKPEETSSVDGAMSTQTLIILLAAVNGSILLVGGIGIAIVLWKRKKVAQPPQADSPSVTLTEKGESNKRLIARFTSLFSRKKTAPPEEK
ncbi:TIGR03503 family protein [Alteromonas pelagimontana]|uniref:TIGR03503 family protein n=1 Tax=Alteromonas pelagimontana TaxID=1858656 RepID=A0A6M4M9K1_9ALTE|nr:TIGR03503 family protein [Alteromonas pelagimontana]QJR79468.1 TIGR03503 family protein [Alteromonas pelagimontana]